MVTFLPLKTFLSESNHPTPDIIKDLAGSNVLFESDGIVGYWIYLLSRA